jgi:hypothetical protein
MSLTTSSLILVVAMFNALSIHAQECPQELKWEDATFAQRTIKRTTQIMKADIETFANASVIHLDIDGVQSGMIDVLAEKRDDSIQLTFGDGKPRPVEFSEISMAAEPPMSSGTWPRMKGPCSIPDGDSVDFDEGDMSAFIKEHAQEFPKFRGTLTRGGLRISYSMTVEGGEAWQGEVNYARELKKFDLRTDVQGWHVFRANSLVETIPVGKPVSVLSVIEQMRLGGRTK